MKTLDKLITVLENHPSIQKYHLIQEKIKNNPIIAKKTQHLKCYQQNAVRQNRVSLKSDFQYNKLLNDLKNEYLITEYFNVIEEINELIELISNLISFNL